MKPGSKVEFSKKMLHMLGFDIAPIFVDGNWRARSEPKLDPIEARYVFCDVVDHNMVGDIVTPLLRIVQVNSKKGRVTNNFESIQYYSTSMKCFDTIEISLRDDTGANIPFTQGKTVVILHFRRAST